MRSRHEFGEIHCSQGLKSTQASDSGIGADLQGIAITSNRYRCACRGSGQLSIHARLFFLGGNCGGASSLRYASKRTYCVEAQEWLKDIRRMAGRTVGSSAVTSEPTAESTGVAILFPSYNGTAK